MIPDSPHSYAFSKLGLLATLRYWDLFSVVALAAVPKIGLLLSGVSAPTALHQPDLVYTVVRVLFAFVVLPVCVLTALYINRSFLRGEPAALFHQYRRAFGDFFEGLALIVIEYSVAAFPLGVARLILIASHVIPKDDVVTSGIVLVVATTASNFIFAFSIPLLVNEGTAYLKNIRNSLALFKAHRADLSVLLPLGFLVGIARLPEVLHVVNRSSDVLLLDLGSELLQVVYYLLAMNYDAYYRRAK